MGRRGLKSFQFETNRRNMLFTEQDAAAAEGRCQANLTREAYEFCLAKLDGKYHDPQERLAFWHSVEQRIIDDGAYAIHDEAVKAAEAARSYKVYDLAKKTIEGLEAWMDTLTVYQNGIGKVYITNWQGLLSLHFENDGRHEQIHCGMIGTGGWIFDLDKAKYRAWADRCQTRRKKYGIEVQDDGTD